MLEVLRDKKKLVKYLILGILIAIIGFLTPLVVIYTVIGLSGIWEEKQEPTQNTRTVIFKY